MRSKEYRRPGSRATLWTVVLFGAVLLVVLLLALHYMDRVLALHYMDRVGS